MIDALKRDFPDFFYPVSSTTREKRPGEVEGGVYNFISREEFEAGISEGKFLEYAVVHSDNYYGTQKEPIMKALEAARHVVREIDIQGFESIKKEIPPENLVSIFLYVNSWEVLRSRILRRHQESDEELEQRRESFEREMERRNLCDYQVESREGEIQECVDEVEAIIRAHL